MKVQTWFAAGILASGGLFAQAPARTVESYLASAKTAAASTGTRA